MAFIGTEIASSSCSSSSALRGCRYHVFLSFRGIDTRKNFTDHLYTALKQNGIFTFRDDEKLERGKTIDSELMKAIEESKIAIVILSKDYASSSWCLIELAKIIECMKKTRLIVLHVFHYVDPSDVRYQRGTFAEAFAKHEERFKDNIEDVNTWRAALTNVANLSGFDLRNKDESKVIEQMVGNILGKLFSTYPIDYKDLVGINSRMEKLVSLFGMGLNDVRFIGIWGMGGMGKTTLAQVVYDRFHHDFEGSSFLANVREQIGKHGLVYLQKQLLSNIFMERDIDFQNVQWGINMIQERFCHKRVLVILDDVDQPDQLEALAGEQSWFGQGSRIIITTRDHHLLISHQVAEAQIYKVEELNNDEALKLFSRKDFKEDNPLEGYVEMCQKFINYAGHLPLALKVLGSFLFSRGLNLWESALVRFKENPPRKILDVLQISFDGLEEREKNIFLDIACFFKGEGESRVTNILQTLYDRPEIDIDVLLKKSLITISLGCFQMHDLLQELGKEIVRRESPKEPGRRSRLWLYKDILHVLKNNTGTKQVESIVLTAPLPKNENLNAKAFSKMKKLRILEIRNGQFPQGLSYLSIELHFINWHGCPLESMPNDFQPNNLVELRMMDSRIKRLWRGVVSLNGLKLIDLCNSQNLIEIPDLSGSPNLKELILQGCTGLSKIDPSFGNLKCLIRLNIRGCKNLESLSDYISLESLEYFDLSDCSRLKKFPKIVGNMSHLWNILLENSGIKDLSVEHLTGLIELDLSDCKNLSSVSDASCSLSSLQCLNLYGCSKLDKLPENLGNLKGLKRLSVCGTAIRGLPPSIARLKNLSSLDLSSCTDLQLLPELPLNIKDINADGCTSLETLPIRPEDDFHPSLHLLNCVKLIENQGYGSDIFLTMLRRYFQRPDLREIDVFIPGSEIPKWFRHQSVGASMEFLEEGPSDFMGVAVCAVFVRRQHHPLHQSPSKIWRFNLHWFCNVIGCTADNPPQKIPEEFVEIDSYNLWLKYFPFRKNGKLSPIHTNGLSQITIECKTYGAGMEVTKCGACLVDQKAIEDLKQSMTGCSMIPYDGDELGTTLSLSCGEAATSNDVDVPHPKRIRLLNLNEIACEEEESSETASYHESPRLINFFSL